MAAFLHVLLPLAFEVTVWGQAGRPGRRVEGVELPALHQGRAEA